MTIYFDPKEPERAVLEREAPYSVLCLVLGIVMVGLSAVLFG